MEIAEDNIISSAFFHLFASLLMNKNKENTYTME
jgi:hypothetical protein